MESNVRGFLVASLALWGQIVWAQSDESAAKSQWPSFRGEAASGVSEGAPTPTHWNVPSGKNIKWKTPIPGLSHSSPIVWDNRIFITAAVSEEKDPELKVGLYGDIASVQKESPHSWNVYCIDKASGAILWEKTAHSGVPKMKRHPKSTHANSTPATDGKHVVALFASEGLYCYTVEGDLLWKKDLGALDSGFFRFRSAQWGFASSPVIHDGVVIVQCDVQKDSFLTAFDVKTGNELWRTKRDDVPTWSTPTVYTVGGKTRVVINGFRHTGGYDFATGKEVWKLVGGGDIPIPTPVVAHDLIFITSAHGRMSPMYAVKTDVEGDVSFKEEYASSDAMAWSISRGGSYMSTGIVYGDYFYNCRNNGSLTCLNAKTGEVKYKEKLGAPGTAFSASPVASDGKIYFTSEKGEVFVVKAGPNFEVLATNAMDDICMATPAISDGALFFRTQHYLIALAE